MEMEQEKEIKPVKKAKVSKKVEKKVEKPVDPKKASLLKFLMKRSDIAVQEALAKLHDGATQDEKSAVIRGAQLYSEDIARLKEELGV